MFKQYSLEQQEEFIAVAKEMGLGPAMRSLGFPSSHYTAKQWFVSRGMEVPYADYLRAKAAGVGQFYKEEEKLVATQLIIDRIVEKLETAALSPEEINKLSNALQRAIETMNLIEGKATRITDVKDGTDLAINELLNEAKARNALKESEIVQKK